jgi:uncharacterized membrane protein YdjX (TVP38/TMEM64 family)
MDRFIQHGVWRRAIIVLSLCIALAALASSEDLHVALIDVLDAVQREIERHPTTGALLFVAVAAVSAMFTFVSIAIIVPAAIFSWGEPASLLLLWVGWILGGVGTYGIGRLLGRPAVRWLTTNQALYRFENRVQRDAPLWLVLLLQLALPSEITGYALGIARYPFSRYMLALGLAELPYTFATVYLGASFLQNRSGLVLAIGVCIALLSVMAFYLLRRLIQAEPPIGELGQSASRHPRSDSGEPLIGCSRPRVDGGFPRQRRVGAIEATTDHKRPESSSSLRHAASMYELTKVCLADHGPRLPAEASSQSVSAPSVAPANEELR